MRGHTALRILKQHGWEDVRNLDGGYTTWAAGVSGREHRSAGGAGSVRRRPTEIAP